MVAAFFSNESTCDSAAAHHVRCFLCVQQVHGNQSEPQEAVVLDDDDDEMDDG
jgi:hypothetical protein